MLGQVPHMHHESRWYLTNKCLQITSWTDKRWIIADRQTVSVVPTPGILLRPCLLTSPRNNSNYANNPVGLVFRRGVFGDATGGVRVCQKCSRLGRWVIARFSRGHLLWVGGILHHLNATDVRTAPRPQFNCPYLSVDANSTEFNPESKHPVVCYLPQPRSFLIKSSRRFARTLPTSRVISTGDWNAGAQPGADGRHHALGEEENYFQVQEQRDEYVSSRRQHFLPVSPSYVLWFLIAEKLYGNVDFVDERHRHRFEVETTDRTTDLPLADRTLKRSFPDLFSLRRWTQRWRPTLRKTVSSLSARMLKGREWRFLNWRVSGEALCEHFTATSINTAQCLECFMAEPWVEQASFFPTNTPPHCPFRPLLLCGRTVPSWVHLQAHQTFAAVLRPPAGRCGKTPELPGQGLPALAAVRARTALFCLNISGVGWNKGPALLPLVVIFQWCD